MATSLRPATATLSSTTSPRGQWSLKALKENAAFTGVKQQRLSSGPFNAAFMKTTQGDES